MINRDDIIEYKVNLIRKHYMHFNMALPSSLKIDNPLETNIDGEIYAILSTNYNSIWSYLLELLLFIGLNYFDGKKFKFRWWEWKKHKELILKIFEIFKKINNGLHN